MANFHRITPSGDYYTNGAVIDEIALAQQYSVQFNGSSQYLTSTNAAGWLPSSLGDWTIEAWFYLTGYSANYSGGYVGMIASSSVTNNNNASWQFGVAGSASSWTNIYMTFWTSLAASSLGANINLNLNTWYHIACTKQGTTVRLFINGALLNSGTPTTNNGTTVLRIGDLDNASFRYFFPGYISNFRIVKGTALYTSSFTVPSLPLPNIIGTSLLTCQSPTIIDNGTANTGGTGFTISNPATATVSSSVVPTSTGVNRTYSNGEFHTTLFDEVSLGSPYSVQFNGSSQYLTATGSGSPGLTTENFTIECWFSLTGLTFQYPGGSYGACILNASNAPFTGGNGGVWLIIGGTLNTPTDIALTSSGTTVGPQAGASGLSISLNVWHHLAISRNGSNLAIWLDGTKLTLSTNTIATSGYTAYPISIGVTTHSTAYAMYFPGYISNLRIVKGTPVYDPTGGDILPPAAPLTAVSGTYLLTCQSSTIIDNSTNGFAISNPATATVSSSVIPPAVSKRAYSNGALQIVGQFDDYTPIYQTYSASFNGSTQYLTAPASAAYAFGTGDFTIEFWAYWNSPTGSSRILTNRQQLAGLAGTWSFSIGDVSTAFTEVIVGEPGLTASFSSIAYTWTHFAVCRVSGQTTIYKNGSSIVSAAQTTNFSNFANPLYIARSPAEALFPGYLSNIRIVKGTALYTQNFIPSSSPLQKVPNTSLLTLQNGTIIDNSGNGITISNPTSVTTTNSIAPF